MKVNIYANLRYISTKYKEQIKCHGEALSGKYKKELDILSLFREGIFLGDRSKRVLFMKIRAA